MILLSAEKITKSYSEKRLLEDISLYLNEGDRVGVVGVNGTGKSTLLKIIAGLETPALGNVVRANGVRVGYLPQNPDFSNELTVIQQVFQGASAELQELKAYEAKSILTRLGITEFDQKVTLLSGGQKKRVAIASALVNPCEVLILDEPTNHIDNDMVLWLEKYLARFTGALLMVTHDRYFLDRVTNRIVELDHGRLYSYDACNYTKFLELKAQREDMALGTERKRQSILRNELEWIHRGVRARGTKSKSRVERFEELKSREAPPTDSKLELSSIHSRLGKKTVELENISKGYDGRTLIRGFDYLLQRDARVGVIGKNGCGKSTLLKLIYGTVQPDEGTRVVGETVRFGYFSQECEEMDIALRVIDYIRNVAEQIRTVDGVLTASQMLETFLFPGELQYTMIGRLSGGERRRLFLCRVLMEAPNVLLLDEPTNDLDIQTLMILEDYLEQFQGAVIVVSHDRYFLDKVVDHVLEFQPDGTIRKYLGGYTDYFDQCSTDLRQQKAKEEKQAREKNVRPPQEKKLKFSYKEQREYEQIDQVIAELEGRLEQVAREIEQKASDYARLQELLGEKEALEHRLEEQTERWVYLNDLAEQIAAQQKT